MTKILLSRLGDDRVTGTFVGEGSKAQCELLGKHSVDLADEYHFAVEQSFQTQVIFGSKDWPATPEAVRGFLKGMKEIDALKELAGISEDEISIL